MTKEALLDLEARIPTCPRFQGCSFHSQSGVSLSTIAAGDPRRGHRDPKVLILTQQPNPPSAAQGAYTGQISKNLLPWLCDPRWRIRLAPPEELTELTFEEFLQKYRIYCTSVVKCAPAGARKDPVHDVIKTCRREFLDPQIRTMDNLALIIPMGKIATAAVLREQPSKLGYAGLLGGLYGVIEGDANYGKTIVSIPHPSGANRKLFHPPRFVTAPTGELVPKDPDDRRILTAAIAIRKSLEAAGFEMADLPPPEPWQPTPPKGARRRT